jgi:hypothetical protein
LMCWWEWIFAGVIFLSLHQQDKAKVTIMENIQSDDDDAWVNFMKCPSGRISEVHRCVAWLADS